MSYDFVANFIRFPTVQTFWKSVKNWEIYRELQPRSPHSVYTGSVNQKNKETKHYTHQQDKDKQKNLP